MTQSPSRAIARLALVGCLAGSLAAAGAALPATALPAPSSEPVVVKSVIPKATMGAPGIGAGPRGVAFDSENHRAYVANYDEGTVSVIDTKTNAVVKTIPHDDVTGIGTRPMGVAADPEHDQVYVTNYYNGTVSVISTATDTVAKVITIGGEGHGAGAVAIDEEHDRAYVATNVDSTVTVVDTTTGTVEKVLPHDSATGIGTGPSAVAVDPLTDQAYVTNFDDATVSIIDTAARSVKRVLPRGRPGSLGIGLGPQGVAVDSARHRAYVTNSVSGTVSVIDTTRNSETVIAVIDHDPANGIGAKPQGVAVDTAGGRVLVANGTDGTVSVIDAETDAVTQVVARGAAGIGRGPFGVAVDPITVQAYVTNADDSTVSVLDVKSAVVSAGTISRIGGADRFEVSAAVSASTFKPTVPVAFVASGGVFPDALSGSAAAGAAHAPVLLVKNDGVPPAVDAELTRLQPAKIVILGGTSTVGTAVETALKGKAPVVERIGGADRFAVSAAVSKAAFPVGAPVAYVASGAVFPDALAGSAAAGNKGGPVLLVTKDSVPDDVAVELRRLKPAKIVVLGGTATISEPVLAALGKVTPASVTRIAGADRFAVAANISAATFGRPASGYRVYIASGAVFPDALSGSAAAIETNAPVLLVTADTVPAATLAEIKRLKPQEIVVLGGTTTITPAVYDQLKALL